MVPPCYRHRIFSFEVIPSKLNNITSQCVFSNFLSFSFLTFDVAIHQTLTDFAVFRLPPVYIRIFSNFLSFSFLTFDVAIHLYLLFFAVSQAYACIYFALPLATARSTQFFELYLLTCFRIFPHLLCKCLVKPSDY